MYLLLASVSNPGLFGYSPHMLWYPFCSFYDSHCAIMPISPCFLPALRPILPHHVQLLVPPVNPRVDTVGRHLCCRICADDPQQSPTRKLRVSSICSCDSFLSKNENFLCLPKHLPSPVVSLRPCPRHPPILEALWSPTATSTSASFLCSFVLLTRGTTPCLSHFVVLRLKHPRQATPA